MVTASVLTAARCSWDWRAAHRDRRQACCGDHQSSRPNAGFSCAFILRARILAIACGYEDADDLDHLRSDPTLKIADRITETATRVRIAFAAACPEGDLIRSIAWR